MAREIALGWIEAAEDDLRQVTNNLEGPTPTIKGAAYHCQQAAEKLVKSLLAYSEIKFPRTHDIGALVALVPIDHLVHGELTCLRELTAYAVAYRYPAEDAWDVPSHDRISEWSRTLRLLATKVRAHVAR